MALLVSVVSSAAAARSLSARGSSIAGLAGGSNDFGPAPANQPTRRAVLLAGNDRYEFDIIDPEVQWSALNEIVWEEQPRYGLAPWLVPTTRNLRKLKIKAKQYRGGQPLDEVINRLNYMSSLLTPMTFAYGASEAGLYRITDISANSVQRQAGTNNVTEVDIDITLTKASDAPRPRPITQAPAAQAPSTVAKSSPSTPTTAKRYTIKRGDSLWSIAQKFYNNGADWPRIAKANNIKNVNRISPGQELTIP